MRRQMEGQKMSRTDKAKLMGGFAVAVVICILVFIFLTKYMSHRSEETLREVSNIYMSEINHQIKEKFSTVTNVRLLQLQGLYKRTPPDAKMSREQLLDELRISAEVREFSSLAFVSRSGTLETVYGDGLSVDMEQIFSSLDENSSILSRGHNPKGEVELVLGLPAEYKMNSGETSDALIMSIPMDHLNEALFLADTESGTKFRIIDDQQHFVTNDGDFLAYMLENYQPAGNETVESFIGKLAERMENHEPFFGFLLQNGVDTHIYCSPIEGNSNWYLISSMPETVLSQAINGLDYARTSMMLLSIAIVVVGMLLVFIMYYRMTRQQMQALAESRKEARRASQAKSEFLSSMSHDIRTPMNAIIGMSELASRKAGDPEAVEEYLRKIRISSKHLLGLINDVLDMSKIESGKVQISAAEMSIKDTMDDIVNIIQPQVKAKHQYFDIFIENIICENVCCDAVRLNQVLINLLSNAVKFTPEEGRIDVHAYQEPSPKGDNFVRTHFVVEDNGIGMSKEFQKKIYDTFSREETEYTNRITGTGLGMSITKSIVDLMGGTIELDSEVGKGTKFHVILDMERSQVSEADMKLPNWNVLVVDDNELLCTSAASNLRELGTNAEWTTDGYKAVEMIEKRHEAGEEYQFVLIDWKMPNLDGIQTIRRIRQGVGKQVPVFLISAYDWNDVEENLGSLEIEGFIPKPLFKSTLYHRLCQYVEGYTAEEAKPEDEVDFTGKRVLLAEDIDINWEVASEILSTTGLALERAENGRVCVDMFDSSPLGYYDAVLMDVRMPVMNGYDATRAIRQLDREDKDLPIIAMTADAFTDDVKVCLECGMNGHLAKPIDLKECIRVLREFLFRDKK